MNEEPITRHRFLGLMALIATGSFLAGCEKRGGAKPAAAVRALDPDQEPTAILAEQLSPRLGPLRKPARSYRLGSIVKCVGFHYWQMLADGMSQKAVEMGVTLDIQSVDSPPAPLGQLKSLQTMVARGYDAILISPHADPLLEAAILEARRKGIVVIVVAEFAAVGADQFVGPRQYDIGVHAARFFIEHSAAGGEVALISGRSDFYHVKQRAHGFVDTLMGTKFKLVADKDGLWEMQRSLEVGASILARHPKLVGFYCLSDFMALGAVQAVKDAGATGTLVVGTNAVGPATDSIRAGGMSATVDTFPVLTGGTAVEVALRLLDGQMVPRVVYTPLALVTRESLAAVPAE